MGASGEDGKKGLGFSVVSGTLHCIYILSMSINISVQIHIVTRTMSLASIAPIKCSMLPNPAPFLMQFPSARCHDPK